MLRAMSEADLEKVYDYARFITRDKNDVRGHGLAVKNRKEGFS